MTPECSLKTPPPPTMLINGLVNRHYQPAGLRQGDDKPVVVDDHFGPVGKTEALPRGNGA